MVEKMKKYGYESVESQMYGSAYTTANYIAKHYPEIKKVRVVGGNSIKYELAQMEIKSIGGEDEDLEPK